MELWEDIIGYEGYYQVSNKGRVRSVDRVIIQKNGRKMHFKGNVLKPFKDDKGYLIVDLGGKNRNKKVHRLVAEAFIPNPNNYPIINHKDENPSNNCVENLEWCTHKYNSNYGTRNERVADKQSKKVYQYTLEGELIKIWKSIMECGRNGFSSGAVSECCRGIRKTHMGYKWSY